MLELLRHGDTGQSGFRGRLDDALSAYGWEQMEAAVAGRRWQCVLSSPLHRCREFAEALARQLGAPLQIDDALVEYDFGSWSGRTPAELHAEQPEALARFWADPASYTPAGAEPMVDFETRVNDFLQRVRVEFEGRHVIAVTHGGLMRLVHCQQRGWPLTRMSEVDIAHAALMRVSSAEGSVQPASSWLCERR